MAGSDKPRVLVVCGPTATGKTDLAIALCRAFGGEMVGADSMQVYSGLPVGTAALRPEEAPDVPRHLIGTLSPSSAYSVADYVAQARTVIADIHSRGRLPVVCGGTGLYISSLVNGIAFTGEKAPPETRAALEAQWAEEGAAAVLKRLGEVDPAHAAKLSPADKKRILRSLEEYSLTGQTYARRAELSRTQPPPYNALLLALTVEPRPALYQRIDDRVDNMMAAGLLAEARQVYDNQDQYLGVRQAIGYKEFFPYFRGEDEMAACVAKMKQATRNYAKRQLTWFRRMKEVHWLVGGPEAQFRQAQTLVETFMGGGDGV